MKQSETFTEKTSSNSSQFSFAEGFKAKKFREVHH